MAQTNRNHLLVGLTVSLFFVSKRGCFLLLDRAAEDRPYTEGAMRGK